MTIQIRWPEGFRHPVKLKPLSARLDTLSGKTVCLFYSWQDGTLYDNRFFELCKAGLEKFGAKVEKVYKRRAFDQNDAEERAQMKGRFDAVIYFGASSCSTSKYAAVYGGYLDAEVGIPTVAVTYETFVKDCEHANFDHGTNTRCVYTTYPGDKLPEAEIDAAVAAIAAALTSPLNEAERDDGTRVFEAAAQTVEVEDAHAYLYEQHKTDGNPVVPPTPERVEAMLKGTSLSKDQIVAERVWPNCSYATVETIATVAVMAGLQPQALPVACALAKAYSDAPGQALVVSTNSFGFLPVIKGSIVEKLGLNYREHAMSSVPGRQNAAIGRFLRLLQIAIGGWRDGENAFGVIGNPMLGSAAVAENPSFTTEADDNTVTLITGCWSYFGNYMNMDFGQMVEMAKQCDYQTGLYCVVSPLRAQALVEEFGSLEAAGEHYQQKALVTLREFWDMQDWQKVFTKPQLELGAGKGELEGYPRDYLRYFENPEQHGDELVQAFPKGGIRFCVAGGSASKMMRAVHGAPVAKIRISDFE